MTHDPVRLIETAADFTALVADWTGAPVIGIDTEAASFHRYRDRVYLLQLSTKHDTVVVDLAAAGGLEPSAGGWRTREPSSSSTMRTTICG
ncbi:MAG: hypothetical protein R2882_00405 [Gemmatimonadales bacterium]